MGTRNILLSLTSMVALTVVMPSHVEAQQEPAPLAQGGEVYLASCIRCHVGRPSAERTDREWTAIIAHMRARANMSKSDAEAVLAFLQATNAPETGASAPLVVGTGTGGVQSSEPLPEGVLPGMITAGESLFKSTGLCFACHGMDAKGLPGVGSDLTDDLWLQNDGAYDAIVQRIREGVSREDSSSGAMMPARGGSMITEEEVRAIASYVWALSHAQESF